VLTPIVIKCFNYLVHGGCSAGTLDFIEFGVTPHLLSKEFS
jgi:hypothetical protein